MNVSTATYVVTDEHGSIQPSGTVMPGSNGSYAFTISLHALRNGNDTDGRQYTITVSAQDNAGNKGSGPGEWSQVLYDYMLSFYWSL